MKRQITELENHTFDAVVIGGGIHGATAFHQLAKSGLKTALFEKGDFGEATSANSLKILHGGLRYLQHLNYSRMRESIMSRWHFMEVAPHLIKPMPCLMATKGMGIQSKLVMAVALKLFDFIARDRNKNAPEANKVGTGRVLSKSEILKIAPGIDQQGLTGAALWYDDLILHTERMTLEFIKEAVDDFKATAANYLQVEEILRDGEKVSGVRVKDCLSGKIFFVRAKSVINAAGPWSGEIASPGRPTSSPEELAKAVNIVINRPLFDGYGIGLSGTSGFVDKDAVIKRGKRLFFFAPWKECTIVGTTYRYYRQENDLLKVTSEDIETLINEINSIYPLARLKRHEVTFAHAGLVPAHSVTNYHPDETPQLVKHSNIIDHAKGDNIAGLYTIEGVKYTTAPEIARKLLALFKEKGLCKTSTTSPEEQAQSQAVTASENSSFPHIPENFGKSSNMVFSTMKNHPEGDQLLMNKPPLTVAEVIYCVEEEMCMTLLDLVLRRTEAALFGLPSMEILRSIAMVMADKLAWDEKKVTEEVDSVSSYFINTLSIDTVQQQQSKVPN